MDLKENREIRFKPFNDKNQIKPHVQAPDQEASGEVSRSPPGRTGRPASLLGDEEREPSCRSILFP